MQLPSYSPALQPKLARNPTIGAQTDMVIWPEIKKDPNHCPVKTIWGVGQEAGAMNLHFTMDCQYILIFGTDRAATFHNPDYNVEKQFSEYISVKLLHPKGIM